MAVTNNFTEFTLDVDNIVTYQFALRNLGDTAIASTGDILYDLTVYVSNNADPTSSAATTQEITPLLTSATNLNSGIDGGSTIVIENVHTMINIATTDCPTYEEGFVCIVMSKASGASYTDSDTTNNYHCLPFSAVADGGTGTLTCAACVVKTSLLVMFLSTLLAYLWSS